jgi:hypothetical protein
MRDTNHVPLLREVEKKYGKKVLSYADCLHLSKAITQQTGFRLNVSTLRRSFGLVKATYPPSPTTKDILAKFIGYNTFEHFCSLQQTEPASAESDSSLLVHYLEVLFSKASATTYSDPTWLAIMRQTILFLDKQPQLVDSFQRVMAKTVVGQNVYFEQFINIDQLNGYYGKGLRYYLAEKLTKEAKLFSHSLLALRSYLTEDDNALTIHYTEVMQHTLDSSIHPFVCARYYASQLFFHQNNPEALYKVLNEARSFFKEMLPSKDVFQSFPCFELVITEALILIGQPLEAMFYLREQKKKKSIYIPPAVDVRLFDAFDLYEAIALTMLGDEEKAKKALRRVNPAEVYFLSRQYHNVLYLLAESVLFAGRTVTLTAQLDDLIQKLGFVRLYALFENMKVVNKKEQELDMIN